ncbi:MAG: hypothetical protein JW987_00665 [Anaerolineaceae bacterium]|nr:hypothetical protein [Anaerolineaceae bacterium]
MVNNYLEQLVAEWYEFRGYFVRRNIMVAPHPNGGFESELDVIAYHPKDGLLVHIEPSMDADSWEVRERRFSKKFQLGREYIPKLFEGIILPREIRQIALLGFASKANHTHLGGGEIMLVNELLLEILSEIKDKQIASEAIPEHLSILRTLQFVSEYRKDIKQFWK